MLTIEGYFIPPDRASTAIASLFQSVDSVVSRCVVFVAWSFRSGPLLAMVLGNWRGSGLRVLVPVQFEFVDVTFPHGELASGALLPR